jgi:hypothetical protein
MTPVPEELRVHVTYRFSDVFRASARLFVRTPIFWIVTAILVLFDLWGLSDRRQFEMPWLRVSLIQFLVVMWLIGVPALETFKTLRAPHMKHGLTFVFTHEGVAAEYTGVCSYADWSFVRGAYETNRDIFVKMRVGAHVIPKSQISAEQSERLRQIVRAHVPKAFG